MSNHERPDPANNVEELREQIDHTRDELAQTVEALAARQTSRGGRRRRQPRSPARRRTKATVLTAQAKEKAADVSAQARVKAVHAKEKPVVPAVGGAAVLIVLFGWFLRRRHNRRS